MKTKSPFYEGFSDQNARFLALPVKVKLGFRVVAFDPYLSQSEFDREEVERVEFATLPKMSDVISLHAPLDKSTEHLLGEREFDLMKPSAFVVNTARGRLIDEKALYGALVNKKIARAALDVLESEFPGAENPLLQLDNVTLTPHVAWYSETPLENLRTKAAEGVVAVSKGEIPKELVNRELIHS